MVPSLSEQELVSPSDENVSGWRGGIPITISGEKHLFYS